VLFSATFNKKVRYLCQDYLEYPIQIIIGKENQANQDVKQEIMIFDNEEDKYVWLEFALPNLVQNGKVLIFVNTIRECQDMEKTLVVNCGFNCGVIHGDKLQYERTSILNNFRKDGDV
jgi:superfamily II DNA/RNA helicase